MVLKIAVQASGAILADGEPVELDRLDALLEALKANQGVLWYYREHTADAETVGTSVMQVAAKKKLGISISSKPDFSDYLDAQGVSHPRAGAPQALQEEPAVTAGDDMEAIFANVRKTAAGEDGPRGLVIVRPDRRFLFMPALEASPKLDQMAAGMERMIPSAVKRNIAVIGDTGFAAGAAPNLAEASRAIPFLGLLTGLTYIGHSVWVFEGHESALAAGCREADVLIVDGEMAPRLKKGWEQVTAGTMRNANILLHDRNSFKLRFVRKVGGKGDRLEFAN